MLEIYEASHGGVTAIPAELSSFESVEHLVHEVAAATGVPAEHVLLFLEDGRDLKDEVLQELWSRGGQGSQSDPVVQHLYLFNRNTFYAETPEHWAAQFQEDLVLPPPLNLSAISDLSQAQIPFIFAHDHLQHLFALLQAQCSALSIAYESLSNYLEPLLTEWDGLQVRAKAELERQYELLQNSEGDMVLLRKITILDVLAKRRDREKSGETEGSASTAPGTGERTLASYVNAAKMEQVKLYEDTVEQVYELAEQSAGQRAAAQLVIDSRMQEFREGIERMEDALRRLEELFEQGSGQAVTTDLMELDSAMREDLAIFTDIKNDFTLELHYHIKQVAHFQVNVAELTVPIGQLDEDLTGKSAFPHIQRLHQLPFAYAATVVEVVRRKEMAEQLQDLTKRINAEVAAYLEEERKRRGELRDSTLNQLPWSVGALDEDKLEWKVVLGIGNDLLDGMQIGREDVNRLLQKLEGLVDDPELASQESNPVPQLIARTKQLLESASATEPDFWAAIQRAFSLDQPKTPLQDGRVDELERELTVRDEQQAELERMLTEAVDAQARLQREADASAEAQWGAEAELRERMADYERDRDEARDVIGGLQADVAQDKSRINDLGVRLQEALLDVDGLRNAEQALYAQIQELQEERTRHLTALSEAQSSFTSAQSELAGLRAELAATAAQLGETRLERDNALKDQSAEAERLMRDRIAEADGDRAVLEHQTMTLTKQLEDAKVESEQKLSAARNAATRTADGLKAELSFTKAQLRDVQRRESVLADELALAKDKQAAASVKDAYSTDVAKDAVALAGKYHEACARLLSAIMASSTIASSGAGSTLLAQSKVLVSPEKHTTTEDNGNGNVRDSILLRSLATAQSFDLDHFSASVTHTISLVRKLGKTCRHYRDQMRSKISFTSFAKGDLALFLPTRNANTRPWMAYNIAAPHHFLKLPDDERKREMWKGRDSIVARILSTEESVAGDTTDANPFGLAEGLRFYIHSVEEYVPTAPARTPRRSQSASVAPSDDTPVKVARPTRPSMGRPAQSESALAAMALATSPSIEKGETFPTLSEEESGTGSASGDADDDTPVKPLNETKLPVISEKKPVRRSSYTQSKLESAKTSPTRPTTLSDATTTLKPPIGTPPLPDGAKLSPVFESFSLPPPPPSAVTPLTRPSILPPFATRAAIRPTGLPMLPPAVPRPESRRSVVASPQPSVRPSSRSSTHTTSSIMTNLIPTKGTPAPAMAVTASGDGSSRIASPDPAGAGVPSPRLSFEGRRASVEARRPSAASSKPPTGLGRTAPSTSPRNLPSPFDAGSPESEIGLNMPEDKGRTASTSMEHTLRPQPTDQAVSGRSRSGSAAVPTATRADGTGPARFFTVARKRLHSFVGGQPHSASEASSSATPTSPSSPGTTGRSSAQDMLRRFDS